MIKAAILDMDGTLLESMGLWVDIGPRYLDSIGVPWDEQIRQDTKLMLLPEMGNYFRDHSLISISVDQFIDDVNAMVEKAYYNEVVVKPGVIECLENFKNHGIKMVLATATDRHLVEAALKRNNIINYFDTIFTCAEVGADKQVPKIYDEALKFLGTKKNETYVFEDTLFSIKTAKAANYPLVAVYDVWSEKHSDQIKALADVYVTDLRELDLEKL